MRLTKQTILLLAGLAAAQITARAQTALWPEVKKETKPWTRWWWMGNAVDEKNIGSLLESYNQAGIGGVEIAPIYGAKGYESRYVQYLSPQWMQLLNYTSQKAGMLNMGVDLTNGTGWPFGGPQVPAEYAAARLIVNTYKLGGGETLKERLVVTDPKAGLTKLQAVTAYSDKGEVLQLLDKVDQNGNLKWTPKAGNWEIYAAFNARTRQMVKRAAPGGEGFTLNHFSRPALNEYLSRFDKAFKASPPNVRAFYNDSYEVYNADWSDQFFEEFQKRRGYDLRLHLRDFMSKEKSEKVARLKSDYRETMAEMLLDNFTIPWTNWAHQYNAKTKNQAHGSPGNLLDLYAAVDIPECETFGSSYFPIPGLRRDSADIRNVDPDPVMLKFASSGGHVVGHNLVSCETFTWLTEHFKTSLSQAKPEVEQVFLSGVNHVFYHGTTYSPEDVKWPGWLFYASVNMVPANSLWSHVPGLNSYITRVQSVLQAGKPDNEVLVYWPVYDAWNDPKGMDMPLKVHDVDVWLHPTPFYKNVTSLQSAGYSLDFISDNLLKNSSVSNGSISTAPNASPYKVLVVPKAEIMPVETLQKMIELARNGATVIIQQLPNDVPGLQNLEQRRKDLKSLIASLAFVDAGNGMKQLKTGNGSIILSEDVQKALAFKGLQGEKLVQTGLKFVRRQAGNDKFYYLVNHTPKAINTDLPLNVAASSVLMLDPQTGNGGNAVSSVSGSQTNVKVQIQPGEALILKATADMGTATPAWTYLNEALAPVTVNGTWNLDFTEGGPTSPQDRKLKQLVSWTDLQDSAAIAYSGKADYTITFKMPKVQADEFVLDLGKVHESARVWVNGQDAGILWSIPYQTRIGKYLKPGKKNTIRIEVANLMANRIRDMDRKGIQWRNYHEINFVNINYKNFDASNWKPQPSGLIGPVTITPYKK
ncbi:glycosyl hydrolase [Pedobacter sp. SYSU D00535]|uniref:glycosyl hydrolase n=1 Tax=Pedobacter sp. SYSU D00535 TaxID=2810308 RepID=UPI001A95ABE4|nr:glycosyl hydrolase [Pedobacter sp. SYSU D00535]